MLQMTSAQNPDTNEADQVWPHTRGEELESDGLIFHPTIAADLSRKNLRKKRVGVNFATKWTTYT